MRSWYQHLILWFIGNAKEQSDVHRTPGACSPVNIAPVTRPGILRVLACLAVALLGHPARRWASGPRAAWPAGGGLQEATERPGGSPFAGSPKSTNAWRTYELASGSKFEDQNGLDRLVEALPVPTTSIFKTHRGLGHHPAAVFAIADRLAQPESA
jgi:hypothetical protein